MTQSKLAREGERARTAEQGLAQALAGMLILHGYQLVRAPADGGLGVRFGVRDAAGKDFAIDVCQVIGGYDTPELREQERRADTIKPGPEEWTVPSTAPST
jgi:hypothetical protein